MTSGRSAAETWLSLQRSPSSCPYFPQAGLTLTSSPRRQTFLAETKEHQPLHLLQPSKRNARQGRQPPAPRLVAIVLGLPKARPFRSGRCQSRWPSAQIPSCADKLPPVHLKMEKTKTFPKASAWTTVRPSRPRVATSCSNFSTDSTRSLSKLLAASKSGDLLWLIGQESTDRRHRRCHATLLRRTLRRGHCPAGPSSNLCGGPPLPESKSSAHKSFATLSCFATGNSNASIILSPWHLSRSPQENTSLA